MHPSNTTDAATGQLHYPVKEQTMPTVRANGLNIEYVETGEQQAPVILLIMGLGMQLIAWPDAFCQGLADQGFRVVRFDNRDVGHSTKIHAGNAVSRTAAVVRLLAGGDIEAPYTLSDMAADTIGVMDALGIARAHIVGASMGGMIAQIIAAEHAERVRSLVSIMSSSGDMELPRGSIRPLLPLLWPFPGLFSQEHAVKQSMHTLRTIGSPGFPTPDKELRAKVERSIARSHYPQGLVRQILAIAASGSRVEMLRRISAPTLVIHGADDPLIPTVAGEDTADNIPGARLKIIPGMGHDLAAGLVPHLVEAIAEHCHAADRRPVTEAQAADGEVSAG
jgi:pimeloyl-ACP methyl ester carboxylesterase